MKTFYDVLKVSEKATIEEISSSYEELKKRYESFLLDPEKKEKASEYLKKIEIAYKVLGNTETKSSYDKDLYNMRNNELMNNLQKNTSEYNKELEEKEELKRLLEEQKIKDFKKEQEEEKKRRIEAVQAAIQKQIEEQQKQINIENENKRILQEKIAKEYKKYIKKNKKHSISRTIFAIVVVFLVVFLLSRIPFIKNLYINQYNNLMNIFE